MQNEQYFIALIQAVLGIQPYPITSPSDAVLPFIIWNMNAGEEESDLSGPTGFREETYQFTIVARTYDEVVDIREDLRTLLQNSSPLMVVNDGETPVYDSSEYPNLFVQNVTYTGLLPTTQIVSPQVLSASYAATCSFLTGTIESASYALKAKLAETASYMVGAIESASYAATAAFALNVPATASHALVADLATTASYALNTPTLPDGLVSSSAQIDYTSIQNKPTSIESASYAATASYALNTPTLPEGLVSSSAQVLTNTGIYSSSAQLPAGLVSSSAQVLNGTGIVSGSTIATASYVLNAVSASHSSTANLAYTLSATATASYAATAETAVVANSLKATVTASHAIIADTASYFNLPANIVSSSAQVDYTVIQNKPTTIATASYVLNAVSASYAPLPSGVVSSSAQVLIGSNVFSASAQLPAGLVSGSQQAADWTVTSSSYAVSASWAPQPTVPETSSYALHALSASTIGGYSIWVGTTAQYNALSGSYDAMTLYFVKA
jgi:hypothetical protein